MDAVDESIDQTRVASLLELLGATGLGELLTTLDDRLTAMAANLASGPEGAPGLAASAHKCRGSASSLGLITLAVRLARFEALIDRTSAPCSPPEDIAEAWADLIATRRQTFAILFARFPDLAVHYSGAATGALKQ
jgi:HPt (histidine-containing phosphotransfer) domain-containing protein